MSKDYIIGIDAGGTKISAAAFDDAGLKLFEHTCDSANITVDTQKATKHIFQAIETINRSLVGNCLFACVGCAGIETGKLKSKLYKELNARYLFECFVTNDAELSLYSAFGGNDGILVISGTGSIAYIKHQNVIGRFGGWGHLIGDEGSGYSVGINAIRTVTCEFDSGIYDTSLKTELFSHLNITDINDLIDFTYNSSKSQIAALSEIVSKLAQKGDEQACRILKNAGKKLSELAIGLIRRFGIGHPSIAISGSLLQKETIVRESFLNELQKELNCAEIKIRPFDPSKGAYYIWLDKHK